MKNITFLFGILGTLFFIMTAVVGGLLYPNYSHIQQMISESYALDAEYNFYLRSFGVFSSGLLMMLFGLFALRILPKTILSTVGLIGFTIFYGLGTIIVSLFPCDTGCNKALIDPSISQIIHNFIGALTYLIVPLSLILIGVQASKWTNGNIISKTSLYCGIIAVIFTLFFMNSLESNYIGIYQRVIEASILFWVVRCAFYIKNYTI